MRRLSYEIVRIYDNQIWISKIDEVSYSKGQSLKFFKYEILIDIKNMFITCIFSIIAYFESQGWSLRNSINIIAKDRFLAVSDL